MDANTATGETPPGVESDNSKNAENLCIECEENYLPKGHIGICDRCKDRKFWEQRNKEKQEERKRAEIQQSQQKATAEEQKENAQLELGDEVICLCGKKGTVIESPYDPCLTVRFEDGEIGIFVDDGSDAICNACFHGD